MKKYLGRLCHVSMTDVDNNKQAYTTYNALFGDMPYGIIEKVQKRTISRVTVRAENGELYETDGINVKGVDANLDFTSELEDIRQYERPETVEPLTAKLYRVAEFYLTLNDAAVQRQLDGLVSAIRMGHVTEKNIASHIAALLTNTSNLINGK